MLDIIRTSLVFEFAEMYYTHIPHYVQDAFDFRSFPNRVLSNEKFLAKRVARYVKMIRSKAE